MGVDSVSIYYKTFKQSTIGPAVVISSGRTEAAVKYKELIFDLYNNGYSIYIHDHRGQGLSGRMTTDPDMGYVRDFQDYITDLNTFYDRVVKAEDHSKIYLLAHSMGGAIGMRYLQQFPNDFNAAAFSSPMLGLIPPTCAIVEVFNTEQPKYALGQNKYNDDYDGFKGNTLTTSQIRYNRMVKAYEETPEARLGGATYTWVFESCEEFKPLFNDIDKIETPFVLFSAEKEKIVYPYAHQKFYDEAKRLGKVCEAFEIESANHELLIEKDTPRMETINTTLEFFERF